MSACKRWIGWAMSLGLFACPSVWAVDELDLKTAIVFNLLAYAEWPADAPLPSKDQLVLCVSTASPLAAPLKTLHGRPVRNQKLDVREVPAGAPWPACQVVYVDAGGPQRPRTAPALAPLVVSDDLADAPPWAAVILRRQGARIGFDVNLDVAREARVQLSSKLLRLARTVRE